MAVTLLLVSFQGFFVSVFYCFLNSEVSPRGWGFFLWHPSLQADKFSTRLYCCTGLGGCWSLIPHLKIFDDQSWCFTCSPRFCPDRNGCCLCPPLEEENPPPRTEALRVHLCDLVQQSQGSSPPTPIPGKSFPRVIPAHIWIA